MNIGHTPSAKQRSRVDVRSRAGAFGVEARDNRALPLAALVLLAILAHAALVVAVVGLAIFAGASALRRAGLRWVERQRAADLDERNEDADATSDEADNLSAQAAIVTSEHKQLLQALQPTDFVGGRLIASVALTPRLFSFFAAAHARTTRAAA